MLVSEAEMRELKAVAHKERLSVGEWVRRAIHSTMGRVPSRSPEEKLSAINSASLHSFPAADVDQMNREIEEGYLSGLH